MALGWQARCLCTPAGLGFPFVCGRPGIRNRLGLAPGPVFRHGVGGPDGLGRKPSTDRWRHLGVWRGTGLARLSFAQASRCRFPKASIAQRSDLGRVALSADFVWDLSAGSFGRLRAGGICCVYGPLAAPVVLGGLRFYSGSIWPAVLGHASWNAIIQTGFDAFTNPKTPWLGESGRLVFGATAAFALLLSHFGLLSTGKMAADGPASSG